MQWFRFAIIGLCASLSYFLLGLLFVKTLSISLLPGNALAYILSFAISYLGQSRWTFNSRKPDAAMLPRFAITQGIGMLINSLLIEFFCSIMIPYALAMLLAIAIVPIIVYLVSKHWVFATNKDKEKA